MYLICSSSDSLKNWTRLFTLVCGSDAPVALQVDVTLSCDRMSHGPTSSSLGL